jgi:hypothetical protein
MDALKAITVHSGAHVVASFVGQPINAHDWQPLHNDPAITVATTNEGLRIEGTTSREEVSFSGLASRHLYPADAELICEVKINCDMAQNGTYGAVVHLCNRLIGDEVRILEIPDNSGELDFGRFEGYTGWFGWYYDQTAGNFYTWQSGIRPRPSLGNEQDGFTTVRVSYSEPDHTLKRFLLHNGVWEPVGEPVVMRKVFSAVELKADAQAQGLDLDFTFRNCRLFPHPARNPVRLYVGAESAPCRSAMVEMVNPDTGTVIAAGIADSHGMVNLPLNPEGLYPVSAFFKIRYQGKEWETLPVHAVGVQGVYPGAFYAINPLEGNTAGDSE